MNVGDQTIKVTIKVDQQELENAVKAIKKANRGSFWERTFDMLAWIFFAFAIAGTGIILGYLVVDFTRFLKS